MKKKKDLLMPTPVEKDLQREFTAVISTLMTQKEVKKKVIPKIKQIEKKLKKRKAKVEIRRLMKE